MRFAMKDTNTENAYNCRLFQFLNCKKNNDKKHVRFLMENRNTKQSYNFKEFPYLNIKKKKSKNICFVIENQCKETAYRLYSFCVFQF